ncbi:MAG: Gfo/Idh/MocA family oxidoreductase [Solirubrobacterales bacterium]|nr:Gfo/Idh/MocA family oxidoreductase [Solirubrobacterales bacterium]
MASREPIGVGLVGLGYWGPNHLRVVEESTRAKLKAICDADPSRLERAAAKTDADVSLEFEELLVRHDIDAIIVSTPIGSHFSLGMKALEAGKHVLVEKPLAATSKEADQLVKAGEQGGLSVMCGHTFLFSPPVIEVKRMLDSGDLGDIYFVTSSRVNLGLHQRDVSVLWDLAPHDFSILSYWLDETPDSLIANGRASIVPDVPDVAFVNLSYGRGITANVELSWLAPSKMRRTTIVGSEQMVVYEDNSPEQVRVYDRGISVDPPESFGEFQLSYRSGGIYTPKLSPVEPMASQFDAFVDSVMSETTDRKHANLARDVVRMIEAAEISLQAEGVRTTI